MTTYDGNAIYDRIAGMPDLRLVAPGPQVWPLIYCTNQGIPKAMVVACQVDLVTKTTTANRRFLLAAWELSQRAGLPFRTLCFLPGQDPATASFAVFDRPGAPRRVVTSREWRDEMAALGLPVLQGGAHKAINRASSSTYHDWQRANLGSIRAVDLDLLRMDEKHRPCDLIELKRSSIPLDRWQPFSDDSPNFEALARFCRKAGLGLELVFNRYDKATTQDDLTTLKVFSYQDGGFVHTDTLSGDAWFDQARPVGTVAAAPRPPRYR